MSMRQLIQDEKLNYRPIIYRRSRGNFTQDSDDDADDTFYIEFKKKKLLYRGKKSHLITMTDVTASLKYTKVRQRVELLDSL